MQWVCFRRLKLVGLLNAGIFLLFSVLAVRPGLVRGQASTAGHMQAAAQPGGQNSQSRQDAQAEPFPADSNDVDSIPVGDDGPSPGNFLGSTYVPSTMTADSQPAEGGTAASVAAIPPPPAPVPADAGGDPVRQQVNDETANLLAMAYALKAEVDKTNKDTLSISVVRKANQIEQLARKERDDMRPALSRN